MKKHKYLYAGSELVVSKGGEVKLKAEVEVGMAACQPVYCLLHLGQLVQLEQLGQLEQLEQLGQVIQLGQRDSPRVWRPALLS